MDHERAEVGKTPPVHNPGGPLLAAIQTTAALLHRCEETAELDRVLVRRSEECVRSSHEALAVIIPGPHSGLG